MNKDKCPCLDSPFEKWPEEPCLDCPYLEKQGEEEE